MGAYSLQKRRRACSIFLIPLTQRTFGATYKYVVIVQESRNVGVYIKVQIKFRG